jgi:hypothetical protein
MALRRETAAARLQPAIGDSEVLAVGSEASGLKLRLRRPIVWVLTVHEVKFFAVGTNMDSGRLQSWDPSAQRLGIASLSGFTLRWNKRSSGGGKLTPLRSSDVADVVWGVRTRDGRALTAVDEGDERWVLLRLRRRQEDRRVARTVSATLVTPAVPGEVGVAVGRR